MQNKPTTEEFLTQAQQSPIFSQFMRKDFGDITSVLPKEKLNHRLPGEEWVFDGNRYDYLVYTPYNSKSLQSITSNKHHMFYGKTKTALIHSNPIDPSRIDELGSLLFPKCIEVFNSDDSIKNCIDVFLTSLSDSKPNKKTTQQHELKSKEMIFQYLRVNPPNSKKELSFDQFQQETNKSEIFYHKNRLYLIRFTDSKGKIVGVWRLPK